MNTQSNLNYRVATPLDQEVVVSLLAELLDELGPTEVAERVKPQLHNDITKALDKPTIRIFLAYDRHLPVGLSRADILDADPVFRLRADHRCGYIDQMYVKPIYRCQQIGSILLQMCEAWFREQGMGHTLLHASRQAMRFYEHRGFLSNREMFKRL